MFNKLLEAIDKGISNVLVIDDADSSINYRHGILSSEVDLNKQFMKYIDDKQYVSASELYKQFPDAIERYKVQSLSKLAEITVMLHKQIVNLSKYDIEDFRWMDTTGFFDLILKDGSHKSMFDYEKGDKIIFFQIRENSLEMHLQRDSGIIIPANLKTTDIGNPYIPTDVNELCFQDGFSSTNDGFRNTYNIISSLYKKFQKEYPQSQPNTVYIPQNFTKSIYMYVNNMESIDLNGHEYKPYIPAYTEMCILLRDYYSTINYVFTWILNQTKKLPVNSDWCTSTAIRGSNASGTMKNIFTYFVYSKKHKAWKKEIFFDGKVLPFYKLID